MLTLQNDVVALYIADYGKAWDAMLDDLDLQPLGNPQQAAQSLYILASPQSLPLRPAFTNATDNDHEASMDAIFLIVIASYIVTFSAGYALRAYVSRRHRLFNNRQQGRVG